MCGIIGYSGKKNAINILVNGLKALEYRGYDSSGIAYKINNEIKIIKSVGKIEKLEKKLNFNIETNIGIGHTRWATHGKVSELNSHPHHVGDITLVHNGIIENFYELKNNLSKKGYIFYTETDSEVACALIDFLYHQTGNIKSALIKFSNQVKGSYALAIMVKNLDALYAVRKDSPLIIAKNKSEIFVASDSIAITNYADNILYLKENIIAEIIDNNVNLYDKNLNNIKFKFEKLNNKNINSSKNGYEHYMLKEINEQPLIIKNILNFYLNGNIEDLLEKIPNISKYTNFDIVACGSAYHAGLIGKNLIEEFAHIPVNVEIASEYRYNKKFYSRKTLVIVVSQSGETADSLAALRMANNDNIDTLAIVNVPNSSIMREAKMTILTEAGKEIAVATTKAYIAQITIFALLALSISIRKKTISNEEIVNILKESKKLPAEIKKVINNDIYKKIANKIYKSNNVFFIGRSIDYALALEGSLKLKEISYINCQAYAAGELKHGTISLIENKVPVIGILTDESLFEKTLSNIAEVKSRGALTIGIVNKKVDNIFEFNIIVPKVHNIWQSILTIVPLQLIAYEIAKLKNCDIDKPKNLAKSVTVE